MDYLEFSANVIGSLAWPAVVIGAIAILRGKPLASLVRRLQEFNAFGINLKFRKREKERIEQTEKLKERMGHAEALTINGTQPKIEPPLTSDFPNEDVIAAFEEIQDTLERIRRLVDENLPTYRSIVERLERDGHIETEASQLFNNLREARNAAQATGSSQISTADAREYQRQARLLNDVFKETLKRLTAMQPQNQNAQPSAPGSINAQ